MAAPAKGTTLDGNVAKAEQLAARFAQGGVQHFIDGAPRASVSGKTFATQTPIDDRELAKVAAGDAQDIAAAAAAAHKAFPAWRDLPGEQRRALLHEIADAIEARAEEIALLESLDTGQPIRFMSAAAKRGAENFRFFADKAPEAERGLSLPAREHVNYTLRQADRPCRCHHAVEHAVHAVDVEDRARARVGLHRRAQAGGVESDHGDDLGRRSALPRGCPRACSTACTASARPPARRRRSIPRSARSRSWASLRRAPRS